MLNKEKMKAKCEAWIKEGMGACRAPITYDELLGLILELEQVKVRLPQVQTYRLGYGCPARGKVNGITRQPAKYVVWHKVRKPDRAKEQSKAQAYLA